MGSPGSSETAHKRAGMALGPAVQGEVLTLAGQVQHCRTDANWRIGAVLRLARQCIPDTDRSSAALKLEGQREHDFRRKLAALRLAEKEQL
jgi:hypothetical protein